MKNFFNKKFILFLILIVTASISAYFFTLQNTNKSIEESKLKKVQSLLEGKFSDKKKDIEDSFNRMYETARTISLLPGVRSIEGGNIKNENEDIIQDGRLSQESYDTIQQLYNNLAFNVPVSEIYIVNEGLDFRKGETPFLMLDQLIIQKSKEEGGSVGEVNHDFPEEDEEEEYIHYPKQIADLKQSNPKFDFKELNKIPAVLSHVLRTCDNTQYQSKTNGNVHEAGGILYSVPFYNFNNNLKGIVSVVFRKNIIEAQLVDVPFIIVTPEDKEQAKKDGFSMPKESSDFVIYNKKHNVYIYDRRNPKLKELVNKLPNGNNKDFFVKDLNVNSESKWQIFYHVNESNFSSELSVIKDTHKERLTVMILLSVTLIVLLIWSRRKELKTQKEINAFADTINNMTKNNISEKAIMDEDNLVYPVANSFNNYLEYVEKGLEKDIQTIDNIIEVANEIEHGYLKTKITKAPNNIQLAKAKESINEMLETLKELIGSDINKIVSTLEDYASYDFSSILNTDSTGKIEETTKKLGVIVSNMLQTNYQNSLDIKDNANILEQNVEILNENSSNQAKSLEDISSSIVQITSIVENNNSKITSMAQLTKEVEKLANEGKSLANNSGISMDEINEQTQAIADAIVVIDQIAFQTNILSLNAAVEAATAGEAGKGFAVVAQEVRNLAGKSAEAAKRIKDLVDLATEKTRLGKTNSQNMIEGYGKLDEGIQKTTSIIQEISTTSDEEKQGILLIDNNIQELERATQENSNSANKTKEIAINSTLMAQEIVEDVNKANFIGKTNS